MPELQDFWAKSASHGSTVGESLVDHTREVLQRIASLRLRAPQLPELCEDPRLWHRLALAAALHDLGKVDPGFQKMVQESRPGRRSDYHQRHEVISLAWLNWLLGDDPHEDRVWIAAAIASHHRDSLEISTKYNLGTLTMPCSQVEDTLQAVPAPLFQAAADLALQSLLPMARSLELLDPEWQPPAPWQPSQHEHRRAAESVRQHLRLWEKWVQSPPSDVRRKLGLFCRGLIILADHSGSAHEAFHKMELLHRSEALTQRLAPPVPYDYYPHQRSAAEATGHALLVAPTGSGKTEAALRWAARQYASTAGHPPLFYVLPYKASMNAMQERLLKAFAADPKAPTQEERERIQLQHSSALQVIYHQLMTDPTEGARRAPSIATATWMAKRQKNLAKLHTAAVRVLSPYQLLRAAYQLKGYEALLTDAAGGLFILDEIHAYDPEKLGRILEMMRYLIDELGARVFVMTATMPPPVRAFIEKILGPSRSAIQAQPETYAQFRRHRLKLSTTGLLDDATVDQIAERARRGEAVLCVATMVQRAQELQEKLQQRLGAASEVTLLHGRFNARDRNRIEGAVRTAVATQASPAERRPIVLVATQVVEVSLDVDFDVLFSDPAPLEALLQRFGRVNRSRRSEPHDVIVCDVAADAEPVYKNEYVKPAMAVLREAQDQVIDEALVQGWINRIYEGVLGETLTKSIEKAATECREKILSQLVPFNTRRDLEEMFFEQFDGEEVLPISLVDEYRALLEEDPISAMSLTVPVSWPQIRKLSRTGRLRSPQEFGLPDKSPQIADVPYSSTTGLMLSLAKDEEHT